MKENYRINSVAAQSTYFKTKISKSKDTGIFLDTGAIDFIGKKNDVKFVIYKEDCIIALSNILFLYMLHSLLYDHSHVVIGKGIIYCSAVASAFYKLCPLKCFELM